MALSRQKWNSIIIIASLMMISVLTLLQNKTEKLPDDVMPLFDPQMPLVQLHTTQAWLSIQNKQNTCSDNVLNCEKWVNAWQQIMISALAYEPPHSSQPITIKMVIEGVDTSQNWLLFHDEGLLQSPGLNWYQVPPSQRKDLLPVLDLTQSTPSQHKH